MKVYLTRHGQTYWNREKRIQTVSNDTNNRLTAEGLEDAKRKGLKLKDKGVNVILCSDKTRAYETAWTARLYMDRFQNVTIHRLKELRDGALPIFEGQTVDEIKKGYYRWEYARRERDKFHYRPPQCESLEDVCKRVEPVVRDIKASSSGTYLIVTHRGTTRALLYDFLKGTNKEMSPDQIAKYDVPNDGIIELDIHGKHAKIHKIDSKK